MSEIAKSLEHQISYIKRDLVLNPGDRTGGIVYASTYTKFAPWTLVRVTIAIRGFMFSSQYRSNDGKQMVLYNSVLLSPESHCATLEDGWL